MGESIIKKNFTFSISIIKIYKRLAETKKEYILSNQLLRSGTAIGALAREAQNTESTKDFSKKECNETIDWL
jgi:four helix bundle protein